MSSCNAVSRGLTGRRYLVVGNDLPHHPKNSHARIEGAIGVLEDDLHGFSGVFAFALGESGEIQVLGAAAIGDGIKQH